MNTIRVVLAVDAITPTLTGIGRYTLELARRLPQSKDIESIRFCTHGTWIENPETLRQPLLMNAVRGSSLLRNRLSRRLYSFVRPWLARRRFDALTDHIFHSPNFHLPQFPGRSVATFHDLSFYRFPAFHPPARVEFMQREVPLALERADLIITDSEFGRREVVDYLGFPEARTRVVHLAVGERFQPRDEGATASVLARYGLKHGAYGLYVGTIEPRKNIAHLIAAYRSLGPRSRHQFPLVLAGSAGWGGEAVHRHIQGAVNEGWANYLGYVPEADLPQLYAGARCFVYPSLYEGFGLPVLEAMASGIPVLTSNRASLPEVASGAAQLVEPDDVGSITSGLETVLCDEAWRAFAHAEGRSVARRFTWENTVNRTIEVYRSL